MNIRRKFSVGLLGLGLAVVASLSGCDKSITGITDPKPPDQPEPKTDIAEVIFTTPDGGTVTSVNIKLKYGSTVVKDTTLASVANQQVVSFSGLSAGTYIVVVSKTGYVLQETFFTIVDLQIPRASIALQRLVTDNSRSVSDPVALTPSAVTPISVTAPVDMSQMAPGMAGASVNVTGSSGNATVMSTGQSGVPAVTSGTTLVSSVMSAVQVQLDEINDNTSVDFNIPIPVEPAYYAQLAGQTVDLLSYNFNTLTWESIGTATILADGTVTKTLTGPAQLSPTTIVAIGKQPTVAKTATPMETVDELTPTELTSLKNQGVTTLSYDTRPAVQFQDISSKPAIRDAPVGIPPAVWGILAPWIAQNEGDLRSWIYESSAIVQYTIPNASNVKINLIRRNTEFIFTYNWGNGVVKKYKVQIQYTYKEQFTITLHITEIG